MFHISYWTTNFVQSGEVSIGDNALKEGFANSEAVADANDGSPLDLSSLAVSTVVREVTSSPTGIFCLVLSLCAFVYSI